MCPLKITLPIKQLLFIKNHCKLKAEQTQIRLTQIFIIFLLFKYRIGLQ